MTEISRIDREIDAIRKELRKRERVDTQSCESWQRAWDLHPELWERERDLFRQRGLAQQERDAKATKAWAVQSRPGRPKRAKKCPTCGQQKRWAA